MVFGSSQIVPLMLRVELLLIVLRVLAYEWKNLVLLSPSFKPIYSSFLPPYDSLTGSNFVELIFKKTLLIPEAFRDTFIGFLNIQFLDFQQKFLLFSRNIGKGWMVPVLIYYQQATSDQSAHATWKAFPKWRPTNMPTQVKGKLNRHEVSIRT